MFNSGEDAQVYHDLDLSKPFPEGLTVVVRTAELGRVAGEAQPADIVDVFPVGYGVYDYTVQFRGTNVLERIPRDRIIFP